MANLARRQREREPAQTSSIDPFRTFRDLLRWSPFADLDILPRAGEGFFSPDIELKETPQALVLKADLPGMRDEDIDVAVIGNRLTISGRREEEQRREDEQYYAYERQYGTFTRTFVLPDTYDPDSINADMKDGVLTVQVPKRPGAQARHIPVKAQSRAQGSAETQGAGSASEGQAAGGSASGTQGAGRSTSEGQTSTARSSESHGGAQSAGVSKSR